MATLILTVAGSLIGGRIGSAVGAILGQRIDGALFGPKGRDGPRLADLSVQTSSYGNPLPRVHGRARIAGTVIWATDLVETRSKVKAGKGQPKQTVYSYSANFAVALASRPIGRIGRIWADGNLLRGEAGDFKTPVTMRFYSGSESQMPDPLIASAEALGQAPAYRGLAYAVFENFQLGDYGNRIPSLSFEVIADEGAAVLDVVLGEQLGDAVITQCPSAFDGLVQTGGSTRDLLEMLAPVVPVTGALRGGQLHLRTSPIEGAAILPDDLGAAVGEVHGVSHESTRAGSVPVPSSLILSYNDPDRDYQAGLQRAWLGDWNGREANLALPITASASDALKLAGQGLSRLRVSRETAKLSLPWRYAHVRPGDRIAVPGLAGAWVVVSAGFEEMQVKLALVRDSESGSEGQPADAGRLLREEDAQPGTTLLHLLDLPWLGDGLATSPLLLAAARGTEPGWKRAALSMSSDGGATWTDAGIVNQAATMGIVVLPPSGGAPTLFDLASVIEVQLPPWQDLTSRDRSDMLSGANLALFGEELIGFESVQHLGGGVYRLSGLLRGVRGTEWAIANHVAGERFVLIERETLVALDVPADAQAVQAMASGVGDAAPAYAATAHAHAALLPPSPVHMRRAGTAATGFELSWIRRSRAGWSWPALVEVPLGEEAERYRITVRPTSLSPRETESTAPAWTYTAAAIQADAMAGAQSAVIEVRQIGTFGLSRHVSITVPLV